MNVSRRSFLHSAASAAPFLMTGCATVPYWANAKINVAIIGCGSIARFNNVPHFLKDPRCRITIACDMVRVAPDYYYGKKNSKMGAEGLVSAGGSYRRDVCGSQVVCEQVNAAYGRQVCREVFDWRDVIADPTVDAVCICTPDHWHGIISVAAMRAGKHVYCQKPISMSVAEGRTMSKVAKETGMVFQCGNQGRSDAGFRLWEELVLNGYAGKATSATIAIPGGDHWEGHGRSPAVKPLPDYLSEEAWNLWQGPARHFDGNAYIPSIHEPTCWRFNNRYGGGMITDFGAHEFDMLQRALGTDLGGPVAIENMKTDYSDDPVFTWAGKFEFDFVYANGFRVHVQNIDKDHPRQTMFHCEKGDIGEMYYKPYIPKCFANFKESDFTAKDKLIYAPKYGHCHESDFLDAIIENRESCAPCEIGHRTISMSHIANVCERLRLKGIGWDPAKEVFTGKDAAAANALLVTTYHNGWKI